MATIGPGAAKNAAAHLGGFTLIELMIAVAIVAILAATAYPSYLEQIRKGRRSAAQSWLMELATREQQLYTDIRSYTADLSGWPAPGDAAPYYDFSADCIGSDTSRCDSGSPAGFILTATPISGTSQDDDPPLSLASDGTKMYGSKTW